MTTPDPASSPVSSCECGPCWQARRARVLAYRKLPDTRFMRAVDEHSASAYTMGRCKCDMCRDMANEYRRNMRARLREQAEQ